MNLRRRSPAILAALLAFAIPSHAIPPPPTPPDPVAMAEANRLADELIALAEEELRHRTRFAVSSEVTGWLVTTHPDLEDPATLRAFRLAILARVDAVWVEERPNIQADLANIYRLLPAADLTATRTFMASPSGRNFGRLLTGADIGLLDDAATAVLYRRLFPELPDLLAAAQKSAAE